MNVCWEDQWCCLVASYFIYKVCVISQFCWPWLTSYDNLLQISKLWGFKKYPKEYDRHQIFSFDTSLISYGSP